MAENKLNVRLVLRNATAAEWAEKNPVLLAGEMGIENDTNKMKIGDGTKAWNDLSYAGVDEQTIKGIIDNNREEVTCIDAADSESKTDTEILGEQTGAKKGDKLIIERAIGEEKASYTAYIYDGSAWAAMDGNYDAANVYFGEDMTYTVNIGTLSVPGSGSGTFETKGKSVQQVLSTLMAKESDPNKTNPSVNLSVSNTGTFEIGTKKNLVYSASLNPGSYTYGPATGITAESWTATCTGVDETKATASGTFENIVAEATAKTVTVTAKHTKGATPVTNLGNPCEAKVIDAGSVSKTSAQLIGKRHMFWGVLTNTSELTSTIIRGLKHETSAKKTLATFGATDGAQRVVVAIPASESYGVSKVIMPSALNFDATSLFVKQGATVSVEGAEGYAAAPYNVWIYQPDAIDASETYTITIG